MILFFFRVTAAPPPAPPTVANDYKTPRDAAYYYYGTRNPFGPNLSYNQSILLQPSSFTIALPLLPFNTNHAHFAFPLAFWKHRWSLRFTFISLVYKQQLCSDVAASAASHKVCTEEYSNRVLTKNKSSCDVHCYGSFTASWAASIAFHGFEMVSSDVKYAYLRQTLVWPSTGFAVCCVFTVINWLAVWP